MISKHLPPWQPLHVVKFRSVLFHIRPAKASVYAIYRIYNGKFQGEKFSQISQIKTHPRTFIP